MTEDKIKPKKKKRVLTRKEAIRKGNKEFKSFTRELARSMNSAAPTKSDGSIKTKK